MYYVYIVQSIIKPKEIYKGFTTDLKLRLKQHNNGHSFHTAKSKPWKLIFYCAFEDKQQALNFEKYLKTGSGIAFMRKRFLKITTN